jgi:hypothetical protein
MGSKTVRYALGDEVEEVGGGTVCPFQGSSLAKIAGLSLFFFTLAFHTALYHTMDIDFSFFFFLQNKDLKEGRRETFRNSLNCYSITHTIIQ